MFILNRHPDHGSPLLTEDADALGTAGITAIRGYLDALGQAGPTPLHSLPALARELGIAELHLKDEGARLGLGSFKALGGAYAVSRLAAEEASRRLERPIEPGEMDVPEVRAIVESLSFACATDGNHGRSVAAGARRVGARAIVFMHEGVSDRRVAAIEAFGAQVVRVPGNYDDSVREAASRSAEEGWIVVSDTSWVGYERIPRLVMQGYTALVAEALEALDRPPTHLFVQAGVGGLAAAAAAYLAQVLGDERPSVIVVEPSRAACVLAAARVGHPLRIAEQEQTVMAMLECYEASGVAWGVLSRVADAFMTVEEAGAVDAMRRLAYPLGDDPAVVAGESGGAGVAGLLRAAADPATRAATGLDDSARVLVINSEGATDPDRYEALVQGSGFGIQDSANRP